MRMYRLITTLLMSMLVLVSGPTVAQGNGMQVNFVPIGIFNPTIYNFCTNEEMVTYGDLQIMSQFRVGPSGRVHAVFKVHAHTAGAVGASTGIDYKAVGFEPNEMFNASPDNTGSYLLAARFGWVSQSADPNFFSTFVIKITVNANGDFVVNDVTSNVECR